MRVFLAINLYNCTGVIGVWVEAHSIRIIPERNFIWIDEISWGESSLREDFHLKG